MMVGNMKKNHARARASTPSKTFAITLFAALTAIGLASCAGVPGSPKKAGGAPVAATARGKTGAATPGAMLVGPAWLLAGYDTGAFFVPLEPGHGTTARVVFTADGKLSGTTGFTAFSGTWKTGKTDTDGYVPVTLTTALSGASKAPNDTAAKFERDLLSCFASSRLLKKEKDSFRLLDGQKRILLRYLSATSE